MVEQPVCSAEEAAACGTNERARNGRLLRADCLLVSSDGRLLLRPGISPGRVMLASTVGARARDFLAFPPASFVLETRRRAPCAGVLVCRTRIRLFIIVSRVSRDALSRRTACAIKRSATVSSPAAAAYTYLQRSQNKTEEVCHNSASSVSALQPVRAYVLT